MKMVKQNEERSWAKRRKKKQVKVKYQREITRGSTVQTHEDDNKRPLCIIFFTYLKTKYILCLS